MKKDQFLEVIMRRADDLRLERRDAVKSRIEAILRDYYLPDGENPAGSFDIIALIAALQVLVQDLIHGSDPVTDEHRNLIQRYEDHVLTKATQDAEYMHGLARMATQRNDIKERQR